MTNVFKGCIDCIGIVSMEVMGLTLADGNDISVLEFKSFSKKGK